MSTTISPATAVAKNTLASGSASPPSEPLLVASNQFRRNTSRRTLEGAPITQQQMAAEGYHRVVAFWINKKTPDGAMKVTENLINGGTGKMRFLRTTNEWDVRRGPTYSEPVKTTFQQAEAWFRNDTDRDNFVRDVLTNPAYRSAFATGQRVNPNLNSFLDWQEAASVGALTAVGQVMFELFKSLQGEGAHGI